MAPRLSFVVPFFNEEESLRELRQRIDDQCGKTLGHGEGYEIIFVDDGSTDGSVKVVEELIEAHREVRLVQLQGNFGKSAALAAGFDHVRGEIIFTMDADLQDDPVEIPRFLEKLDEGYDLVTGYKKKRHDSSLRKVIPSRCFNFLVRRLTGLRLHDINCGFKAYRRAVIENINLYGELHRFTPALAHWRRFRVGEIVVQHHARKHGKSKFGGGRFYRGLVDLLTVYFLLKYDRRPAHFFGIFGALASLAGFGICAYLVVLKAMGEGIGRRPLLLFGVLLIVVGIQFLATGLLAELMVNPSRRGTPYVTRRVLEQAREDDPVPLDATRAARTAASR